MFHQSFKDGGNITIRQKIMTTKTNNVCFEYFDNMIVSSSVEEVKNWINSLPGLTCNNHTEKNLDCILNHEWKVWGFYNQNISPLNKDGFRLDCLKTTGIGTRQINFTLTKCASIEEVKAERAAFAERIRVAKEKVSSIQNDLGNTLSAILNQKSKSKVSLLHSAGLNFTISIGQKGYWFTPNNCWAYVEEYFTHFNGETLITDEGKNVIDVLKRFIDEN